MVVAGWDSSKTSHNCLFVFFFLGIYLLLVRFALVFWAPMRGPLEDLCSTWKVDLNKTNSIISGLSRRRGSPDSRDVNSNIREELPLRCAWTEKLWFMVLALVVAALLLRHCQLLIKRRLCPPQMSEDFAELAQRLWKWSRDADLINRSSSAPRRLMTALGFGFRRKQNYFRLNSVEN